MLTSESYYTTIYEKQEFLKNVDLQLKRRGAKTFRELKTSH